MMPGTKNTSLAADTTTGRESASASTTGINPVHWLDQWAPRGNMRRLLIVRTLRSFVQGYVMVVFTIYLSQIGFPAWLIGLTLAIGGISSAVLTLMTGVLSDRFGRKPFLLTYGALLFVSGVIFCVTANPILLIATSAAGGLGRGGGGGGQAGPFAPAEQAYIAENTTVEGRTRVFAANNVVGTLAAAAGALCAGIPELLRSTWALSLSESYLPLFGGVALVGLITVTVLWTVTEQPRRTPAPAASTQTRRTDNRNRIRRISIAGALNGFGFGFIAGILPYWLHVRYGVSAGAIGPVLGISSLLTAGFSLVGVRVARRFGDVQLITWSRVAGVVATLALPFSPVFQIAAVFVVARMVSAMMAMPVRQSYTMGIVDADTRGSAAGITGVARRLPASISPGITGYLISVDQMELPFFLSASFLLANAVLYFVWFRKVRPLDDRPPDAAAAVANVPVDVD